MPVSVASAIVRHRPRRGAGRGEPPIHRRSTIVLAVASLVALGGCSSRPRTPAAQSPPPDTAAYMIGVMTGTASQGAQEFRAGVEIERRYEKRVRHITFPDRFPAESVTVVAQLTGLAADPKVKIIVVGQAVPGSVTAARGIRAVRPDIRIGLVTPHEDPDSVGAVCDLALETDVVARGESIVATARKMGARSFVHYSSPRHMAQRLLARQRDVMRAACRKGGMAFSAVTAPDPTGSGGPSVTREFILGDVPLQLDSLGVATAFFATDDAMQEPLIRAILTAGKGFFVEQAVPAPTLGYPEALGLRIPDEKADSMKFVNAAIESLVTVKRMRGHFGSWRSPADGVALRAMASLLVDAADRKADAADSATVRRYLEAEARGPVRIRRYDGVGNHWLITLEPVRY